MAAKWVRVRIPGVGEWSQAADKPLREDVGEQLVPGSEHETPYRDYPEPPDVLRPLPQDDAAPAEGEADPTPSGARDSNSSKGA